MKKVFLLFAFVLAASASFAQYTKGNQMVDMKKAIADRPMMKAELINENAPVIMKSAADGIWFARPEGALVTSWDERGYGYYVNSIIVPPYYDVIYKNMSDDKANTYWYLNDNDITEYADEENNLPIGNYGFYHLNYSAEEDVWYVPSYYTPELTGGRMQSFRFGEVNNDNAADYDAYLRVDSIGWYAYVDEQNIPAQKYYGWGALVAPGSDHYLFGSGKLTFKDGAEATSMGVVDFFKKPASSLYVEKVKFEFYTATEALKNGAELTMKFFNVETNEEGQMVLGDKVLATLKCSADDIILLGERKTSPNTTTGEVQMGYAVFQNKVTDEFGTEYNEPFAINEDFGIVVSGFENPDVDMDIPAPTEPAEDVTAQGMQMLLTDGENVWYQYVYGGDPMGFPFHIYGCFDYCEAQDELYSFDEEGNVVDTYPGLNKIVVSNDGKENHTANADEAHDMGAAVLQTNFNWFDEEGLENYLPEDLPDWVTNVSAEDLLDSDGDRNGLAAVVFECEPLPEGVKGRKAELYFQGKGYKSELPIILIQGEVEEECITEINVEREVGLGYGVTSYEPDFTAALAYLGIENATDATVVGINADGSEEAAPGPGGIDGWCDADGNFIGWGKEDTRICVKFFPSVPQYEICDMNGADEVGKTYTVKYGLKANGKMATFVINVKFVKSQEVELSLSENVIKARVEYETDEVSYVERKVELTDDQVNEIIADLGLASLADATVYGWNPTTEEFVKSYAAYDGWRDANGDFKNWSGNAEVPACVKYTDGKTYLCYNITGCEPQEIKCYWAIANDKRAVLVEITFAYVVPAGINGINADAKADIIYNMNGVRTKNMNQKGVYIQNGKKVLVK